VSYTGSSLRQTHEEERVASIISIRNLNKTYASGFHALKNINLEICQGEIFALLGPNGAGKTTLISIICGIVRPGVGQVLIDGQDNLSNFRVTRSMIGLVPQELAIATFESVLTTMSFSRGLFGKAPDSAHIEKVLRDLSLWDKRHERIVNLSGGMKRRVLIAKALAHEPKILFLDEPTAGIDVEQRHSMWQMVRRLRDNGVTIILTTHYIDEAEEMADRIGVISEGEISVVEEKTVLMNKLGKKQLTLTLQVSLVSIPVELSAFSLELIDQGNTLVYTFDTQKEHTGISELLRLLDKLGIDFKDLHSSQSSLEEIFVSLVEDKGASMKP
jgi:ABC-2 type transport system ATP-binding protein